MNVIIFALRGCPIAALGPYGNEWIGTPHLDRLAAEGIVFDQHISDCPDPAAARRAWRTGRDQVPPLSGSPLPSVGEGLGVRGALPLTPQPSLPQRGEGEKEDADLLALLKAAGVRTVLVRATREANDAPAEFYAGWDELFDARPDPADASPADALLRTLPNVLDRLAETPHWLLWIELDRLLPPWSVAQEVFDVYVEDLLETDEAEPPEEPVPVLPWADPPIGWFDTNDLASWELLHRTFAAVVTVFDAELGEVFDLLRSRGLDRTAAWVFTADHGLPLGEHGILGLFRPWLHEEFVHLPLIIRLPNAVEAGRRVSALTQPADLMPTLAGWFGVTAPGITLEPLLHGQAETIRAKARTRLELGGAVEWAIRTPEWAFLLPVRAHAEDQAREPMLFEKPDDRWEVNNLRSRYLELSEELEQLLRQLTNETG